MCCDCSSIHQHFEFEGLIPESSFALAFVIGLSRLQLQPSGMAEYIPHQFCGLSVKTVAHDDKQVISNALTGEDHILQRTPFMMMHRILYMMKFNNNGWAYFEGVAEDGKAKVLFCIMTKA